MSRVFRIMKSQYQVSVPFSRHIVLQMIYTAYREQS